MIFSEQDLHIGTNAFDIINESAWIDGGSIISPRTIALVESNSVGGYVVRFNDIEALSEEYGIDYIDSMLAIAEVNGIDPSYLAVAVNESNIIINPELVYELANVITVPISKNSSAYKFCEACIDGYMNTGNEGYIELLVEDDTGIFRTKVTLSDDDYDDNSKYYNKNDVYIGNKANLKGKDQERGIIEKIKALVYKARDKGDQWIGEKIASLDKMLKEYEEKDKSGKGGIWNSTKSKVISVIKWALEKLQKLLRLSPLQRLEWQYDISGISLKKRNEFRNESEQ